MKRPSLYLVRRSDTYYVRIAIPKDLRQYFQEREIKRSLRTSDISIAWGLANGIVHEARHAFSECRRMSRKKGEQGATLASVHFKFLDQLGNPVTIEIDHGSPEEERQSASLLLGQLSTSAATSVATAKNPMLDGSHTSLTLSGLIKQYSEEKALDKSWTAKTGEENASIYDLLVEILGDIPAKSVDIHRANSVREILLKLPPNIKKSPQYRGKSIADILALKPSKRLNPQTVRKFLVRYSSLFDWAERMEHTDKNPFVKLSPVRTKAENKERDRFDLADLKKLFEAPLFVSEPCKYPYRYWVPLLALYTGARLNEICQLSLEDIKQEGSIWFLDFNDEEEQKRLKTHAARRQVPLHSKLIELGFLEHVQRLRSKSETRLFPELSLSKSGYGKKAGNWFNQQYRRARGISSDEKKSFHSFRHTFVDELIKKQVSEKAVADMVGHHVGKSVTLNRYAKPYSPSQLKSDLEKLSFDLELPAHCWALGGKSA